MKGEHDICNFVVEWWKNICAIQFPWSQAAGMKLRENFQ